MQCESGTIRRFPCRKRNIWRGLAQFGESWDYLSCNSKTHGSGITWVAGVSMTRRMPNEPSGASIILPEPCARGSEKKYRDWISKGWQRIAGELKKAGRNRTLQSEIIDLRGRQEFLKAAQFSVERDVVFCKGPNKARKNTPPGFYQMQPTKLR